MGKRRDRTSKPASGDGTGKSRAAKQPRERKRPPIPPEEMEMIVKVAAKLKRRMNEMNLSIIELQRRSGISVSHNTLTNWLNCVEQPRFRDMTRIAAALDLSLDYLADDSATEPGEVTHRLSEDEKRILEIAGQEGTIRFRSLAEWVRGLGVNAAMYRLAQQPSSQEGTSSDYDGGTGNHGADANHAARPEVKPHVRRK